MLAFPVTLADMDRAKALVSKSAVSVRDVVHVAVMLNHEIREIATFDEGFDRIDGVSRVRLLSDLP